jgi:hypothetical protein
MVAQLGKRKYFEFVLAVPGVFMLGRNFNFELIGRPTRSSSHESTR